MTGIAPSAPSVFTYSVRVEGINMMYLIIYIFTLITQLALVVRGIWFKRLGEGGKKSSMKGGSIALQCRTI